MPYYIENGELKSSRTTFWADASDADRWTEFDLDGGTSISGTSYVDGSALELTNQGEYVVCGDPEGGTGTDIDPFTLNHTLSESDVGIAVRAQGQTDSTTGERYTISLINAETGNTVGSVESSDGQGTSLAWNLFGASGSSLEGSDWTDGDVSAQDFYIRIELTQADTNSNSIFIDQVVLYNFNEYVLSDFDNTVHQDNGHLDSPPLYSDVVQVAVNKTETQRDATQAIVESTWDDTSNNQYIDLSPDGSTWTTTTNSDTANVTFGSATREIYLRFGLSNYPGTGGTPRNETPRFGYNGQSIDSYSLFANPSAVNGVNLGITEVEAIVPQGEIVGDRIEEAGQKSSNGDLLSRSILAPFDVFSGMSVRSAEKTSFDNL